MSISVSNPINRGNLSTHLFHARISEYMKLSKPKDQYIRHPTKLLRAFLKYSNLNYEVADPLQYLQKTHKKRTRDLVELRQFCFVLLRGVTPMPFVAIGKIFKKDHASVVHGINKMNDLFEVEEDLKLRFTSMLIMLRDENEQYRYNNLLKDLIDKYM